MEGIHLASEQVQMAVFFISTVINLQFPYNMGILTDCIEFCLMLVVFLK
jgi:hypothetical protein